jgi:hypothetical protein
MPRIGCGPPSITGRIGGGTSSFERPFPRICHTVLHTVRRRFTRSVRCDEYWRYRPRVQSSSTLDDRRCQLTRHRLAPATRLSEEGHLYFALFFRGLRGRVGGMRASPPIATVANEAVAGPELKPGLPTAGWLRLSAGRMTAARPGRPGHRAHRSRSRRVSRSARRAGVSAHGGTVVGQTWRAELPRSVLNPRSTAVSVSVGGRWAILASCAAPS